MRVRKRQRRGRPAEMVTSGDFEKETEREKQPECQEETEERETSKNGHKW